MSSPPTNVVSAVLLVDKRIQGYESIVSAVKQDVRCIVFDTVQVDEVCKQQSITSFQYMANKIAELGVSSFSSIGIVQHNFKIPYHQFFGVNPSELVTVGSVETVDPTLQSWAGFSSFISGLKITYGVQNLDLMACALYSNPDWKYVIDTLAAQVQMTIRASTDDTGAAELGGNWYLESHLGVNLKSVYFTDSIDSFAGVLDMGFGIVSSSQGNWMNVIVPPSTLAVWGNRLTTTVLSTTLSAKLVNITKVFSFMRRGTTHNCIFALNTNGVLFGFGTKTFGSQTLSQVLNVEANSGFIDYFAQNEYIGLLKSNGTVVFITDANNTNGFIYYTTFTVSNAIGVYNIAQINNDPNRHFGVLDASSIFRFYEGPRDENNYSASLSYTLSNVARVFTGTNTVRLLKRDRSMTNRMNEIIWTNVANIHIAAVSYGGASVFGIDTSNNLLYTSYADNYEYNDISTINAPSAARTNVVAIKTGGLALITIGLILQTNGNVTGWSKTTIGSNFTFTSQNYQAVALYITNVSADNYDRAIQAALKYDGTLYIRGGTQLSNNTNTYSSQPVIDVVTGTWYIAFLLNNGNVILHTSSNTFVTVVSTNNAVGLYIYDDNSVNVILKDGSLVRYYNGSITYDTSVVTYNGSTTQSNTILNSNVVGVVPIDGLQAAAIRTSSSLSSFNKFDLFQYFLSRNNRRINNFNSLNGTYTIDDYRTITLIDPFLPTNTSYKLIIPDYQSSENLATNPYNIKSNITIGGSVQNFITAITEGEQFTVNGDTGTTYVLHCPYVYTVTTSPTFALTKVSSISTAGNVYTIYGDGTFSGIAVPAPTLSNFGPYTIANDRAFQLPTPTSDLATIYGSTWSQLGQTLVGSGSYAYMGSSVCMSEDGSTVIVGAPQSNNPTKGYIGVYRNISGTWTLLGSLLYGDSQSDHFGDCVGISADGTIIAVGASQHNGFFAVGSGYVKVYKFISNVWVQQGDKITGEAFDFRNGFSISLSSNGKIVAMGEMRYNLIGSNGGRVRVFVYDETNTATAPIGWTQLGGDIYGPTGSLFGRNVSLSADGYTVAIAGPDYNTSSVITGGGANGGIARIFQYSSSKVTNITDVSNTNFGPVGWNRVGGDFYGLNSNRLGGGIGLQLSSDATMVAFGYTGYSNMGIARVFKYSSSKSTNITNVNDTNYGPIGWYRLGQDITRSISNDSFGFSVSLSNDGSVLSVGGLFIDTTPTSDNNVGGVVSYSYSSSSNTWSSIGQTLYGISSWEWFGTSVSLSGNGSILAVGANSSNLTGTAIGYVKIYNIDVSGGFTYSSSNTSIADVYSSLVIPRGNGSAVITAEQSGYGGYINKSISANVTVQSPVLPAPTYTYTVLNPQSITKTFGVDASFSLTNLLTGVSNSTGAYTFSSASTAISIIGNVATILAYTPSAVSITASQDASGSYSAGSTTISLLVNRGTPTYQSVSQITKTYLTDVSFSLATIMAGVSNSSGAYTFTSTSSAISINGAVVTILASSGSAINILASQDASGNYNSSSTTISLVVNRATPTFQSVSQIQKTVFTDVSFSLAPIVTGMSNSNGAFIFTPAANANGYITISENIVTILAYTPTAVDIDVYQEASGNFTFKSGTISLLVARKVPSYGSFTPGTKIFGDASFSIVPPTTDNSSTAITYTSSAPSVATISSDGTVVTVVGHGSTTITASQVAGGNFDAGSVTGVLTVNRAAPTFLKSFTIPDKTFGNSPFSLLPLTEGLDNTDGAYSFTSSNPSVVSISSVDNVTANILAYTPTTPITITVYIDACGNYAAATTSGTLTVNRANPTYQSISQVSKTFGVDASFSLSAVMAGVSNSDGAYTFSSSSDAAISINGNVGTILAYTDSAVTITATQDASGNYNASSTTFNVLVARGTPTYQSISQVSKTFGVDASFSLSAVMAGVSNSSGAYTFSSSSAAVTVNGDVATIVAYTDSAVTITATQDASGNYNASSTTFSVLVARGAPTYQSISQVSKTFGVDASFSLSAVMAGVSNSSGAYTFSSSSPAAISINGNVATILAYTDSAVTITATQDASGNYNASSTTFTVLVARGTPTYQSISQVSKTFGVDISFSLSAVMVGVSNSSGAYTFSSSSPDAVSINGNVGTILGYTPSAVTITATQDASGNYNASSTTFSVLVARGTPTYQSVSEVSKTFGTDISFSLAAVMAGVSNSDGAYTFSSSSPAVTVNGDVATVVSYTPSAITITATQDASGNYNASSTTFSVLVARATPTYQSVSQITKTFGTDVSFSLLAEPGVAGMSNSDGAYSLFSTTSDAISIVGNVVTVLAYTPSPITITATQDASGNYASSSNTLSLLINRGAPTYTPISQITKTFGTDVSFSMSPLVANLGLSNSSGSFTYSSTSDAISIAGDVVSILTYTPSAIYITANQEASGNYTSGSTNNSISLLVNRKVPAYGAFTLPAVTFEDAPYSLVALNLAPTSESNATYSYSSSHPAVATVNSDGTVVTVVGQGTTTITASQDASGNYDAGSTTASLLVNRAAPTFLKTFTIPDKTFGDASFSLLPFTVGLDNTDGAYSFSSANTSVVSIDGDYATVLAYSATPITIYVTVDACGNYAARSTSGTLTINRGAPTYQSVSTVAKTFGDDPFSLSDVMSGISNSSGSYTFTSSDVSAVSIGVNGVTATILAYKASAITITASQDASGNYTSGSTTFSLTVARATPTIGTLSLGPLNGYYDVNDNYFSLTAPTSNSLGAFTYTSDNTNVAVISSPSIRTTNLIAHYDPSNPANYVIQNGTINYLVDLTGNNRNLYRYSSGTNVVTVGSTKMLNCLDDYSGFMTPSEFTLSNSTLFMVVRYNPSNIAIPQLGAFYQHGDRDLHLSIIKGTTEQNNIILKSNNDNSSSITLVPNTSYILISRVTNGLRELWAYSQNGSYLYTSGNNTTFNNIFSVMYIGNSNSGKSCMSYIGEIMLYNNALTNSDISNNIMCLEEKWFGRSSSAKIVRFLTSGNANITATQDICGNYGTGSTSSLLRVGATVPTFGTFTVSSTTKTYGDGPFTLTPPTSNSSGAFTFSSDNSSVISISGTTATIVGGGTVNITVTQDPSGSFTRKSVTQSFTVQRKNPNLRNFASIVRSYSAGSFVMTAPETDGSGSFTYSSSNISIATTSGSANFTIVAGGTVTITATQAATANYASANITTTATITPVEPTASYGNFSRPYHIGTFTIPSPTTNSNGTISYVSSDTSVATIEGSTVVINKVGDTTITASIAASSTFLTRDISAIFSVVRGTPTISGLSNQTVLMTQQPYTLSPTSISTGTFSYVSDNSAVVFITNNNTTFNVASVGTANITATISEDASGNFNSRTSVFTITVIRATSNLSSHGTFTVPALMTYGDTPVSSIALPTSNSSGAITYSSANTNVATIHPTTGVITAVGAGWVYFVATQAQTNVYNSNTIVSNYIQILTKSITQTRAEPYTSSTITKYYGDSIFTLGTVSESYATKLYYTNNFGIVDLNTVGNVANVELLNVGSVIITAQQIGNTQYNTSNTLTWNLTVEKGNPTLTGLAATLTKNVTDAPFSLYVSSPSNGAKSYAPSNPDSSNVLTVNPSSGLITLKGPGTATVVVSQASSSLYNAPPNVSCVITVTEAGSALQGTTITSSNVYDSVDMSGASLSGTTVSGTSFAGASLVNAVMTGATVTNSTMTSVNFTGASMANAVLTGTTFAGATMTSVVMTGATVRNSTMSSVNLAGASMSNADISGTTFAGATMTSVVMTGATVRNSTMSSVNLTGASMGNATITGTTFASSTMTNAVLTGATLTDSILTSTNLTGASLARANVSGSSFVGATLANVDLSGATVTNANFTNANISGANITNVAFSPLQKIQLLKNTNNRVIGGIQVSDVSGSTILSAISETSPAVSIPNIASANIKVVIPQTSTNPAVAIPNVVLDTASSDKFYFPINEGEYFQISGVKYYTSNGVVKNYVTDEVVEVISYGSKSIWLIAGSIIANVLDTNTISQSTFTVPSLKLNTDAPFNITVAPTSNSNAPIVYSSNHTSVATIHPTTGVITIHDQGYVSFTATQAATLLYEAGSKTSNELFVNKLVNFTLSGLNQTILMSTDGLLDASAVSLETTDATAVFYVKVSDMVNIFKIQTDSNDMNDTDASDIKYYVFNRKWPTQLKINPAHAMMNKTESNGMLGTTDIFTGDKMLAKHDFLRYLSLRLFNTIHGVDLFSNESDLLENTTYWGEDVNANIRSTMANISTTSSDESMSYDASGNKYLTNSTTGNTNLCRELVRQLTANAAQRFGSIVDANTPQNIPLMEDDTINFKVIFQSAPSQNALTGVTEIPSRSYMVKLVLKNSVSGLNTVVTDSEMYPNSYPYSSSVTTYAPTSASSAVYNVYSPPAPIPFARFGFDGWYYTNSSAWVTSSSRNHIKWILPASSGASSTVGSLRYIRANLKIHNKTSPPFIVVYTQSGSWRKYPVSNNNALVNGTKYSFYVNFNSYSSAPAVIGFTNEGMTGSVGSGSFDSNEVILNIALETSSSAATGTVDFTLSSMVVGEATNEKEYGFEADVPASYP